MKFSVGYQARGDDLLVDTIKENAAKIAEIYFSWGDFPNGRSTLTALSDCDFDAQAKLEEDIGEIVKCGISPNLLLNANCYGAQAQAREFFCKIGDTLDDLGGRFGLKSVTTTSPLIAKFLKQNFENIEVRASVNMGIEGTAAMDYIAEYFDSFYLKREYNRNRKELLAARQWCDKNGKKLYGLANSGCLNFCSAHTFHDNLVAHENEISKTDNAYQFEGQCNLYLQNPENREKWLSITNFIRPEDIPLYEGIFDGIKLATRVNKNPMRVISAYCRQSYSGAVTDLLEPNHSGLFYPNIIENKKIPKDFAQTVLDCDKNCDNCSFCKNTLRTAMVELMY